MTKIKKIQKGISLPKTFEPKYIKFNLTYFEPDRNFIPQYESQLLRRMMDVSRESYLLLMQRPKNVGFEFEDVDINKRTPHNFEERFPDECGKYAIMRLYTNNNPVMARVVGIIVNKIFYIFYVFIGETGYKR